VYILGKPFRLVTDCSAIAKVKINKELIPQVARWWIKILDYGCKFIQRDGSKMAHVDAMIRAPDLPYGKSLQEIVRAIITNVGDWLLTMQLQD